MKKLLFVLLFLFLSACHIPPPTQVQPNMEQELIGLTDIPLTNMPGHEPPECPLECICPNWFGLAKSPCDPCYDKKPELVPEPELVWYNEGSFFEAVKRAADENKLLLVVMNDFNDEESLLLGDELVEKLSTGCAKEELKEHYIPILVTRDIYMELRQTSEYELSWLPGDFVKTPALLFAVVEKHGDTYTGHALPITFEGKFNADACATLRGFYEVTVNEENTTHPNSLLGLLRRIKSLYYLRER